VINVVASTPGAYEVDLDRPLVGSAGGEPQVGDFISPNAQNLEAYGANWVKLFSSLGPGEMTTDANRLPRALRHPSVNDEDPSSITAAALGRFAGKHPEITDYAFSYSPTTTPDVPATVDDSPNILTPGKLAFYPL
jgi:hypothetical protein